MENVTMSLSIDCKICEFVQRIFQVVSGVSECYVYSPSLLYIRYWLSMQY